MYIRVYHVYTPSTTELGLSPARTLSLSLAHTRARALSLSLSLSLSPCEKGAISVLPCEPLVCLVCSLAPLVCSLAPLVCSLALHLAH
jgi:hypothetical protein